ncbi:LytR C-terminal domain-containing protein [Yinghuangia sp. ASG 101]|uniref:LytR C-terminal domain-containing protein n=1 Tax=Yinghuangia sp. ASG 101 TaxID=2896848 RepID=UPI001E4283E6|nr:LytR C-terminal domain-containing protein [Yinghuangia sp. ASG 101]UGQ14833.1 LytR C-terminal domain-containing protein [Yinghuangia sp. ASG 101]
MPYRHRPRRRRFLADLVEPGATFDGFDAVGRTHGVWRRPDQPDRPGATDAAPRPGAWARRGPVIGSVAAVAVVAAIVGTLAAGSGQRDNTVGTGEPREVAADAAPGPVSAPVSAPRPAPPTPAPRPPAVPRGDVSVLDQGRTPVAARALTDRLTGGGWRVTGTAVWRGRVPATTVYHPPGREAEARALAAAFPEIRRVKPSFAGITQSRLVVIVVDGPLAPLLPR